MKNLPALAAAAALLATTPSRASEKLWSGGIEISESPDSYTVRIATRGAASLDVRKTGTTLSIGSGQLPGGARHTQRIELPLASAAANPQTTYGSDDLTITVAKRAPGSNEPPAAPNLSNVTDLARGLLGASGLLGNGTGIGNGADPTALRDQVMDQMAALSRQMDQFADSPNPGGGDLFGSLLSQFAQPAPPDPVRAFDLQELPDRYILSAAIPEGQAKNISVNVDNDRFLTITARHEAPTQTPGATGTQSSSSTRAMTLPGPVRGDLLSMDYKDGKATVTLPKK